MNIELFILMAIDSHMVTSPMKEILIGSRYKLVLTTISRQRSALMDSYGQALSKGLRCSALKGWSPAAGGSEGNPWQHISWHYSTLEKLG